MYYSSCYLYYYYCSSSIVSTQQQHQQQHYDLQNKMNDSKYWHVERVLRYLLQDYMVVSSTTTCIIYRYKYGTWNIIKQQQSWAAAAMLDVVTLKFYDN